MISTLIVFSSIGLALIFSLAYWLSPNIRNKVEEPKYLFMEQLSQHNQSSNDHSSNNKADFSRDADDAK